MKDNTNSKGEIATLLAVASVAVIAVGLLIGIQGAQQLAQPTSVAPRATGRTIATQPSDQTPQACFPITHSDGRSTQIEDPWCDAHLYPVTYMAESNNPRATFNNPNEPTSVSFSGTFCIHKNALQYNNATLDDLLRSNPKIIVGINAAYEYYKEPVPTDGSPYVIDTNDAIRNKLTDAEGPRDQRNPAEGFSMEINGSEDLSTKNVPICVFDYRQVAGKDDWELNYENQGNLVMFTTPKIYIDKILKVIVDNFKKYANPETRPEAMTEADICSMYIHYQSNANDRSGKGFAAYNMAELDLEELLGGEDELTENECKKLDPNESRFRDGYGWSKDNYFKGCYRMRNPKNNDAWEWHSMKEWIKILCSPDDTVTPTPEETLTPTVSVPVTPEPPAYCWDDCKAQMERLKREGSSENPCAYPDPSYPVEVQPYVCTEYIGSQPNNITPIQDCESDSEKCLCMKKTCIERVDEITGDTIPAESCKDESEGCKPAVITPSPSTTPTVTPSVTPTVTPTITPTLTPEVCTFESLAYINVCENYDYNTNMCLTPLSRRPQLHTDGRAHESPYAVVTPALWGTSNNKQIASRGDRITGKFTDDSCTFPHDRCELTHKYSYISMPSSYESLFDPTRKIFETGTPENEKYLNGEEAQVRLYYDSGDYAIIPNTSTHDAMGNIYYGGSWIESCTNSASSSARACGTDDPSTRDVIEGLKVQCGNSIKYGWTVLPCKPNIDYVFVIDTSTSMTLPNDDSEASKMQFVKDQLNTYIKTIAEGESDSRVALITFGKTSKGVLGLTPVNTVLTDSNSNNMIDIVEGINAFDPNDPNQHGTCIMCGLYDTDGNRGNDAYSMLNYSINEERSLRKPVVILLTDGLPNRFPGQRPQPAIDQQQETYDAANRIKTMSNGQVILAAIGFGDLDKGGAEGQSIAFLKNLASPSWAFSTNVSKANNLGVVVESLDKVIDLIKARFNSCDLLALSYNKYLKSKDINGDGVINSLDYFLVIDSYYQEGDGLDADINADKIINSVDLSMIIQDFGTVIKEE